MPYSDSYGFLAFEPRILKHDDHYDNPWQGSRCVKGGVKKAKPIPVLAVELAAGIETKYTSIWQAGKALNKSRDCIGMAIRGGTVYAGYRFYRLDSLTSI